MAASQVVGATGIACATAVVQTASRATMTAGAAYFALLSIG